MDLQDSYEDKCHVSFIVKATIRLVMIENLHFQYIYKKVH